MRNLKPDLPALVLTRDLPERFWDKVERITECGCWIWMGYLNSQGYSRFSDENRKIKFAHRVSYESHRGPIPHGMYLDHLCRVRCCVNPDHLEAVTCAENNQRSWNARGKPLYCKRGHLVTKRMGSECAQCRRLREAGPKHRATMRECYRKRKIQQNLIQENDHEHA